MWHAERVQVPLLTENINYSQGISLAIVEGSCRRSVVAFDGVMAPSHIGICHGVHLRYKVLGSVFCAIPACALFYTMVVPGEAGQ